MKEFFAKFNKKTILFLIGLVLLVTLVRGYNFNEWLLVRADQDRDARTAQQFVENGFGDLRMLGPKISRAKLPEESGNGETFSMGPYYYYVQAFSMKIFNSYGFWTIALPDLIFNLLAIPVFFLVVSKFFSRQTSWLTTILFGFSFLILEYSRFSWNPNQLIFWQLLLIYFLVEFSFSKKKQAGKWFLLAFLALLIISQLHFLAIVGTTLVFVVFLIFQKGWRKLKPKYYLWAFLLFFIFHIPFLASDIKNNGDNFRRMFFGVSQQSSEDGFTKNLRKTFERSSEFYLYFPASINEDEIPEIEFWSQVYLIASIILILLVIKNKIKFKQIKNLNNKQKLALIVLLYFVFFFLINIKVANRLDRPRYWLSIAPVAFFILAFWLEWFRSFKSKKLGWFLVVSIFVFCLGQNLYSTYQFYHSLKNGDKNKMPYKDIISRPYREWITLGPMERFIDYMAKRGLEEKRNICYLAQDYQTKNIYKYLFENKYPELLFKRLDDKEESSYDCLMFYITDYDHEIKDLKEDIANRFAYRKIYIDGGLSLWELKVLEGQDFPSRGEKIFQDKPGKEGRAVYWKDLWKEF
jgi:hypothetical protein